VTESGYKRTCPLLQSRSVRGLPQTPATGTGVLRRVYAASMQKPLEYDRVGD
jgi:hypothetical protein